MTPNSFVFYSDPGHGWLAVLAVDLAQIGYTAADFTRYSHVSDDGQQLYLEEDCDAGKFLAAHTAKYGEPRIVEKHIDDGSDRNFIRRMPRNAAGQWQPFAR